MQTFYKLVNEHWKVYRWIGNALPSMQRQTVTEMSMHRLEGNLMSRHANRGKPASEQESPPPTFEMGQLRRFNESMLCFLPISIVIIDHNHCILTVNGMARLLLSLRDPGIEHDFLQSIRGVPYHEMRSSIDTLFRERNPINLREVEPEAANGGNGRFVRLYFAQM